MSKVVNEIANKVQDAILESEDFKKGWDISVIENNGVVTLRGSVPSKQYVELAERIAKNQEGVVSVNNEMDIDTSLSENPEELNLEEDIKLPPRRQRPYGRH